MFMNLKLTKFGEKKGIILSDNVLKALGIFDNDELTMKIEGQKIIIERVSFLRPRPLDEVFDDEYKLYKGEITFDDENGSETWYMREVL